MNVDDNEDVEEEADIFLESEEIREWRGPRRGGGAQSLQRHGVRQGCQEGRGCLFSNPSPKKMKKMLNFPGRLCLRASSHLTTSQTFLPSLFETHPLFFILSRDLGLYLVLSAPFSPFLSPLTQLHNSPEREGTQKERVNGSRHFYLQMHICMNLSNKIIFLYLMTLDSRLLWPPT